MVNGSGFYHSLKIYFEEFTVKVWNPFLMFIVAQLTENKLDSFLIWLSSIGFVGCVESLFV